MTFPSSQTVAPGPLTPVRAPLWKISPGGNDHFVNAVAVAADGSRVVAGTFYHFYPKATGRRRGNRVDPTPSPDTGTFGTYCYDAAGNQLWANTFNGWQGVYWVAISADGSKVASGGTQAQAEPQGILQAFDGATGAVLLSMTTEGRVNQVALSADGTWLLASANTLRLFQYVAAVGSYVQKFEFTPSNSGMPKGDTNGVVSAVISNDGTTIVMSDYAGNIVLFNNNAGQVTQVQSWTIEPRADANFCHMLDLAPDGKTFAAGGADGNFYLFDVVEFSANSAPTLTYSTGVSGAVYGVAVESDGSGFAGIVNDGEAGQVYFVQRNGSAAMLQCRFPTKRNPNSASLNASARLLAVADGHPDGTKGNFYLFGGVAKQMLPPQYEAQLLWTCPTGNMSWPIVISANGKVVVGGSDDCNVYYFTV